MTCESDVLFGPLFEGVGVFWSEEASPLPERSMSWGFYEQFGCFEKPMSP